jgi:GNAT superfamily N-acetyltransferase
VVRQLLDRARKAGVHVVWAHTLPEENPSTKVLGRCGFVRTGEIQDPDDGPIWRWELELKPRIRVAESSEWHLLREIGASADEMFGPLGIGPFAAVEADDHFATAAIVLVAGSPAVGFACVDIVDDVAHLWQLSVHPSHGRQGIGRALVQAVCEWAVCNGYPAVTLTTFRNVPWNAPFYRRLGFRVLHDLPPGLNGIREHEREIGDDNFGPRVAMRKELAVKARPSYRDCP